MWKTRRFFKKNRAEKQKIPLFRQRVIHISNIPNC